MQAIILSKRVKTIYIIMTKLNLLERKHIFQNMKIVQNRLD